MNTIKFNNKEFEVENFYRNTSFLDDHIESNGNCSVKADSIDELYELAESTITSIQILHDGEVIYSLSDLNTKIANINESFTGDRVYTNISIQFE